ncbi:MULTISPECIES: c-type cytochrome biogenesis protein CcmI [unclassified Saccharibacter]|uniref:c-type cytochrome biogenesis protein CcmI n=1 Tax=unclassified Saccharibacter TaxID=2648722 RepID=UPI0013244018|nr:MULTISPECIES: c-type cytochrome biogenesis protein CcmI [unclassified Saccharibacter]MXV35240.1 c-type cytochrome biogenesis protein CcmI [Saccharibacter sp. EH611]MXV57213.1 c-type cytochrome biogenesis protein CcmI [Saccharibacter sp. EH70]MXV64926.1 c-type cytochrome biogenesis protein CcmI [Saccharibacter sp. EH60]
MFLFGFLIFTLFIFIPIGLSLWRSTLVKRETYNPVEDQYRTELDRLHKDHNAHRLDDSDYEAARFAMQRKLDDLITSPPEATASLGRLHILIGVATVFLIPILALFLYSINGFPLLSAQSADERKPLPVPEQSAQTQLNMVNAQLATRPATDPAMANLHIRRGELEAQMGMPTQTVADWTIALNSHFTPELALQIAELETRNAGHVTKEALALYHRALDASPPEAPWRMAVEARIASGEHDKDQDHP